MFRKTLITFLMGMILAGAAATGTSFPILLIMGILILVALSKPLTPNEQRK